MALNFFRRDEADVTVGAQYVQRKNPAHHAVAHTGDRIAARVWTLQYLRRTPSAGLLLVQLLGILLYPWMETSPRGRTMFAAFGVLTLGVALRVVRRSPWLTWLGLVLALVVLALSAVHAIAPQPALPIVIAVMESLFYFYATGSLIAYMLQDWVATTDELFAAGATCAAA